MLILASTVFAYYTVWTLLMVRNFKSFPQPTYKPSNKITPALRRRLPPNPVPLPTPRLGHPHPRHPPAARRRRGRKFPQRSHGTKQSQESGQSGQSGTAKGAVSWARDIWQAFGRRSEGVHWGITKRGRSYCYTCL